MGLFVLVAVCLICTWRTEEMIPERGLCWSSRFPAFQPQPLHYPRPPFFPFPFWNGRGRSNIKSNSSVWKTIVQALTCSIVQCVCSRSGLGLSKLPKEFHTSVRRGGHRPMVLESMLTFPDHVHPMFLPAQCLVVTLSSFEELPVSHLV